MKNANLKKALERLNETAGMMNAKIELLNPIDQGAVRGGTLGCTCKKNQTVICQTSYSQGK